METLKSITDFFATIWNVFTLEHPLLGIPFTNIYLGIFAIAFSAMILKPLLGIGSGAVNKIGKSLDEGRKTPVEWRRKKRNESTH